MFTAHSGCEKTERDSLESIDKALEFKADAVEVDVRIDTAGLLRISHDSIEHDSKCKPLLSDVLVKVKDTSLSVNFDLKEPRVLYETIKLLRQYGFSRDRIIFTGCTDTDTLLNSQWLLDEANFFLNIEHVIHKICSIRNHGEPCYYKKLVTGTWKHLYQELGYESLTTEDINFVIEYIRATGAFGINIPFRLLTEEFSNKMKEADIPVSVWTVNDEQEVRRCLELNVFNITTLLPSIVYDVIKEEPSKLPS